MTREDPDRCVSSSGVDDMTAEGGPAHGGGRGFLRTLAVLGALGICGWLLFRGSDEKRDAVYPPRSTPAPAVSGGGYSEELLFSSGLKRAHALAWLGDGRIVVAGEQRLRVFSAGGELRSEKEMPDEAFALAADGNVLAVALSKQVLFGPVEALGVRLALPEGAQITSAALNGTHLMLADMRGPHVLLYVREGDALRYLRTLAGAAPGRLPLLVPSPHFDVAFTAEGRALIVDPGAHQVGQYALDDTLLGSWGKAGSAPADFVGCCNPTDLAVLPDGGIVTAEKGVPRLKVYEPDGRLRELVAGPAGFAEMTPGFDLAVDPQGRIATLDPLTGVVRLYRKKEAGYDNRNKSVR